MGTGSVERDEAVLYRRTYINFLTEDDGPERTAAALGTGMRRLAEVKARWDPENTFRINRNIAPR